MGRQKQSRVKPSAGPKLPYNLAQELGTTPAAVGLRGQKRGVSMFHVSQRKEARKAARMAKKHRAPPRKQDGANNGQPRQPAKTDNMDPRPAKRMRMAPVELQHPAEAQQPAPAKQKVHEPKPVKTKFAELLSADLLKGTDVRAIQAEAELQRQLARRLGAKGKAAKAKEPSVKGVLKDDLLMSGSEEEMSSGDMDAQAADSLDAASDEGSMSSGSEGDEDNLDALVSGLDARSGGSDAEEELASSKDDEAEEPSDKSASKRLAGTASTSSRLAPQPATGKYVPPAARQRASTATEEDGRLRRRVTGLVNRLSDTNLGQVAGEVLTLLEAESRQAVADLTADLLLQAAGDGPRATDRFSVVAAAFISGVAARAGAAEIGARFLAQLAERMECAYEEGNPLACDNLAGLLAQLYACHLVAASCVYSLLERLRARFQERDVVLIHQLLKACGFRLRAEDSSAMKDFVVGVHARAAEARESLTQRTAVMLELVLDVKNNRRPKAGATAAALEALLSVGAQRWLRDSRVAEVQLRGVTWEKLLQPNKKGMWWLPSAEEAAGLAPLPKGALATEKEWGAELLQLAAKQRMNTDVRRAVFCVIMGGEDYVDASERLLRLPLKGEAQREIVRVAVDCCLQESTWNPYYAALLKNVLAASQAHCITAQFCIWDHLKELNSQAPRRLSNLARLTAYLITSKALPMSALRVAELATAMTPQQQQFWRTVFERVLTAPKTDAAALSLFKVLSQPQLQNFVAGVGAFLRTELKPAASNPKLFARANLVQKALEGMKKVQLF